MSVRFQLSLGLICLAGLTPGLARAQVLQIGSPNTATPVPPVVHPPVKPCVVELFQDVAFADFSPKPFSYAPPSGCAGPWAKVVLEADWSITAGTQFDRTANVWIGGANVYFGTTSEPSGSVAKSWHVERDLSEYAALFRAPQAGRADLGNLVNATYTSVITGSARLVFYPASPGDPGVRPADLVIPLSASATGGTVALTANGTPLSRALTLPQNVQRAVLDVVSQSQASDEFWYTCVPNDVANELQSCGGTAFRETEVSLDGQPAGVAPVYPWIYTGGIDPFLWAPVPGVGTLDFEPYRVELSPFAGPLSDGTQHTLSLSAFNAANNFATTATLLVWLDPTTAKVTGSVTQNTLAAPQPQVNENLTTAPDGSINGTVGVTSTRAFTIAGVIQTSHGPVQTQVTQQLGFSNTQTFVVNASTYQQNIVQGTSISSETRTISGPVLTIVQRNESWPLSVGISVVQAANGSLSQATTIHQGLVRTAQTQQGEDRIAFEHLELAAAPTDTLTFDANGNFTGNTGQEGSQSYFWSDGTVNCTSIAIVAQGGLLSSVKNGVRCDGRLY